MARRNNMSPDEARAYLAEISASGETSWQPSKPLDEYQDAQVVRKAREFQRMERAGLPIDNQVARGHSRDEHGRAPKLEASREAYDIVRKTKGATVIKTGERYYPKFEMTGRESERAIEAIGRAAPNAKMTITYYGDDGMWHTVFSKGGANQSYIASGLEEYDSFDEWLASQIEMIGSSKGVAPAAGVDYRIVVLSK